MPTSYGPPRAAPTMDPIVNRVIRKYVERSAVGMNTYGISMEDNRADILEWLNHLQEELMDATLYIERLKKEV